MRSPWWTPRCGRTTKPAREKGRTGLTYNTWRDEELTQIAVAWILAGVFVRFLEDNELIDVPFLAGGNVARHQRAQDEHSLFFRQHPTASERDYFEHVFNTVGKLPGMKDFFDRRHNPLWRVGPTADAAKALLEFWRKTDPDTGRIVHDFTDSRVSGKSEIRMPKSETSPRSEIRKNAVGEADLRASDFGIPSDFGSRASDLSDPTRFLGDLYQDLSEFARKRYALLQTPVFVEQFILDRTLTPAISTFGYKAVRMIDRTCGSGRFLLGGFQRLFRLWQENEPGENPTVLARRALEPGDCVRDWTVGSREALTFPYDDSREEISVTPLSSSSVLSQSFWPNRAPLSARKMFGKTPVEHGLAWYQFIYLTPKRFLRAQLTVSGGVKVFSFS